MVDSNEDPFNLHSQKRRKRSNSGYVSGNCEGVMPCVMLRILLKSASLKCVNNRERASMVIMAVKWFCVGGIHLRSVQTGSARNLKEEKTFSIVVILDTMVCNSAKHLRSVQAASMKQ